MKREQPATLASTPLAPHDTRVLAEGQEWSLTEYICRAGPEDRPVEERHEWVTIAAVVAGTFQYHADNGTNVLHPGAFLLGNNGMCYECGHDHSRGDRCIALHIAPNYFEEIAASSTSMGYRFPTGMLPAMPGLLPQAATMEAFATSHEAMSIEEDVPRLIEAVLGVVSGSRASPVRASVRDERRVSEILHFIEENASEALELDELASKAGMSKYHFLRSFRRTAGITPYQFLLNVRLRRTAVRLATTQMPISAVAFEEGFGDLSTFNHRFRNVFGVSPQAFRKGDRAFRG